MLEFHATDDQTIPYFGGWRHDVQSPGIMDWLADWAVRNGCEDPPSKVETPNIDVNGRLQYTKVTYSCGNSSNVVSLYRSEEARGR